MVRAIASVATVDVLCDVGPDDIGAIPVFLGLQRAGVVSEVCIGSASGRRYDAAVMAIPFDGRWRNGTHFQAERVLDGRPRPGWSTQLGFSSWQRHEVEYQMDNAYELGYTGDVPSMSFHSLPTSLSVDPESVYLGLGFKRDRESFWSKKHWGNDRFVAFIRRCREIRPTVRFRATGSPDDITQTIAPIAREVGDLGPPVTSIPLAFDCVTSCGSYFGNDTGMMHVAASLCKPTFGLMAYENVATKNRPWCPRWMVHEFHSGTSDPVAVAESFMDFVWGDAC